LEGNLEGLQEISTHRSSSKAKALPRSSSSASSLSLIRLSSTDPTCKMVTMLKIREENR
jgi:hypothetical protein